MFSVNENDYILSLINRYDVEGYKNYVIHSHYSVEDNISNIICYFSKGDITAVSDDIFMFDEGALKLELIVDSFDVDNVDVVSVSEFSGSLVISDSDYIYTNADVSYDISTKVLNPDVKMNCGYNPDYHDYFSICVFIIALIFGYIWGSSLLRIKR